MGRYMKYICFYDTDVNRRKIKMASVNKINYICSAFNRIGVDVELISCSTTAPRAYPACTEKINEHTSVRYFRTAKEARGKASKLFQIFRRNAALFFYLMFNTKKGETVAAYHSLMNMRCVFLAKKIKGFTLLLEAEEIYNDVFERSKASRKKELKYLDCAEMYMFPTTVLAKKVNTKNKPQAIVYGAYEYDKSEPVKRGEGKIRVAYTGSFDPNKGGLNGALGAAEYLDDRYCLCILGTDTPQRVKELEDHIENHSQKDCCEIIYDGVKRGKDYTDYLCGCDIGLSTQNPDAAFNNTSFPSKVISYLSCDLRVVTYPIEVLTDSELKDSLYFYTENTPKAIAKTIKSIDLTSPYDGRSLIKSLDGSFVSQLRALGLKEVIE